MFLLANPFTCTNSGHELSIILDSLVYIREHNIKNIIIFQYANHIPNNLELLKLLLDDEKLIYIDFNVIYKFKKIHIIKQELHHIHKHDNIINELKNKVYDRYNEKYDDYKNKSLLLLKTNRNNYVMSSMYCFKCSTLMDRFEENDFIYINPEKDDIFKICIMLMTAKKILFSIGAILYTHQMFFNDDSKLFCITNYMKVPKEYFVVFTPFNI